MPPKKKVHKGADRSPINPSSITTSSSDAFVRISLMMTSMNQFTVVVVASPGYIEAVVG